MIVLRDPPDISVLTKTQKKVADLVAAGMSNQDIAGELRMTTNRAKVHVCNCLVRLELKNRVQLALVVHGLRYAGGR